jgi:phage tail sheath protein FI
VGSQKSGAPGVGQAATYSSAELQTLFQAGIDVIANPGGGGLRIWTVRCGHNSSSNAAINGDNYTRLTNYIASSLNAGMGVYIGLVINTDLFDHITATLRSFLANMANQGQLANSVPPPYSVICNTTNNPQTRTSLGYVQADVQVQYMAINEKFIVNIEGGTTVVVRKQTTPAGQAQ